MHVVNVDILAILAFCLLRFRFTCSTARYIGLVLYFQSRVCHVSNRWVDVSVRIWGVHKNKAPEILIHTPMFMVLSLWPKPLREFTGFIWWMQTGRRVAANPQTKPTDRNGCYHPHPPSPFVTITQPESWYSFYRPKEGGRLSRPRHCRKGAQPVSTAVHHSGCRDKHNCLWTLTPQSIMPPPDECDLQRHVGVNNLPEVVTRHRHDWELNSQPSSCKSNT